MFPIPILAMFTHLESASKEIRYIDIMLPFYFILSYVYVCVAVCVHEWRYT